MKKSIKWFSIFLLLDKRMCSPTANECIRIPCTNNLRIPSPQPSRTVSKQNPLRLFRFQITVEIWSLTVILVKTGNHQQLMLQALILSQGLTTKTCPSMNPCSFPISSILSNKTFKSKKKCDPLVHDVTKKWNIQRFTCRLSAMESKSVSSCSKQPASKVFSKALLRRNCAWWSTVSCATPKHVETNRWSLKSFLCHFYSWNFDLAAFRLSHSALKEAVVSSLVRRLNALKSWSLNMHSFPRPTSGSQ